MASVLFILQRHCKVDVNKKIDTVLVGLFVFCPLLNKPPWHNGYLKTLHKNELKQSIFPTINPVSLFNLLHTFLYFSCIFGRNQKCIICLKMVLKKGINNWISSQIYKFLFVSVSVVTAEYITTCVVIIQPQTAALLVGNTHWLHGNVNILYKFRKKANSLN